MRRNHFCNFLLGKANQSLYEAAYLRVAIGSEFCTLFKMLLRNLMSHKNNALLYSVLVLKY